MPANDIDGGNGVSSEFCGVVRGAAGIFFICSTESNINDLVGVTV